MREPTGDSFARRSLGGSARLRNVAKAKLAYVTQQQCFSLGGANSPECCPCQVGLLFEHQELFRAGFSVLCSLAPLDQVQLGRVPAALLEQIVRASPQGFWPAETELLRLRAAATSSAWPHDSEHP